MIQSFITFDSVDRIQKCDQSLETFEQYFTAVLFALQFSPVCNFVKFINFGLGTVRSERVKMYYPANICMISLLHEVKASLFLSSISLQES